MTLNREQMVVNMMAAHFVSNYLEDEIKEPEDGFSLESVLRSYDEMVAFLPEAARDTGIAPPSKQTRLAVKRQVAIIVKAILRSP